MAAPAAWQKVGGCCLWKQLLWAEAGADSMERAPRWGKGVTERVGGQQSRRG